MKTPIDQLTAEQVSKAVIIWVTNRVGYLEHFVCARIGRIYYLISANHGYAYTRMQMIKKYRKIGAEFVVVHDREHEPKEVMR